ncbi:MAG: ABC transporter permease [Actinomycetota bacterium]|nr:ABC transporter permease [Actinomycetota bacterium]
MSVVVQPTARGTMLQSVRTRLRDWIPAIVVFGAGIAVWQLSIEIFNIQRFLLPKPWAIVHACWTQRHELWSAGWLTLKEALGGFAIGSVLGIAFAVVLARFRRLGDALMPIAIAANAIPIIAFSPIFNAWFDPLSPTPRMATAGVLCFFPVMVNTLRGLTSVRPSQIELMRSYAAGELEIFRRVRVPTALPFVFSALKVATVLAMIGAIVSDYFGTFGSLGITIKNSVALFDFETAWAAILVASVLGVLMYVVVSLVERFSLQWDPTRQEGGTA